MAKKEVDGEGLNIPNRIKALPVKQIGRASCRERVFRAV